jgi:hypothetical protein
METRTIEQTKLYALYLNDMRKPKIEILSLNAISLSKDKLIAWIEEQKGEPYSDDGENSFGQTTFNKVFKKGSALEWFNPCQTYDTEVSFTGDGIREYWECSEEIPRIKNQIAMMDGAQFVE